MIFIFIFETLSLVKASLPSYIPPVLFIITSGWSQERGEMDIVLILATIIDFKGDTILSNMAGAL